MLLLLLLLGAFTVDSLLEDVVWLLLVVEDLEILLLGAFIVGCVLKDVV